MLIFVQVVIDVIFACGLIVLAAAHIAGRTTSAELDVLRQTVDYEFDKITAKIDGGAKPK
jgi:hypothetical protein